MLNSSKIQKPWVNPKDGMMTRSHKLLPIDHKLRNKSKTGKQQKVAPPKQKQIPLPIDFTKMHK